MKYINIVGIIIILSTSSCSAVNTSSNVRVGPSKEIKLTITEETIIDLNITTGDVIIESSLGNQFRAEMTVECPGLNSQCAKKMAGLEFVQFSEGEHLSLATNRDSFVQHYNANLKMNIFVPKSHRLNINMDAGELRVNNIDSCLNVNMSAGEININMHYSMIASVDLDAKFGYASLHVNGIYQNGNRSWLVGEEVHWNQGVGHCEMDVDIQAGEISVNLGS